MNQITPVPFWDSPAFTTAMVLLVGAFVSIIQYWIKSRTDAKVQALAEHNAQIMGKVDVIEKHTNGMLTALQTKVDSQERERVTTAEATEKDKEIAMLKKTEKENQ
jgi:hypothetical protein